MEPTRISKDEYYMRIARQVAERSTCCLRHYGAIIVKNDAIVSTGYNGSPRGTINYDEAGICPRKIVGAKRNERYELCIELHAETNAIIHAGRDKCIGSTLYVAGYDVEKGEITHDSAPCIFCCALIANAGIQRVVLSDAELSEDDIKGIIRNYQRKIIEDVKSGRTPDPQSMYSDKP